MRIVQVLSAVALAMRLIQPVPDQLVQQDTDFVLDVSPYFTELPELLTVDFPDFLTFRSRKLTWSEAGQLDRKKSEWEFLKARTLPASDLLLLVKEFGLLVYSLRNHTRSPVLQHYFESSVCLNYSNVEVKGTVASLHSSTQVAIVDVSRPGFPELLASGDLGEGVIKAFPLSAAELLVVHRRTGLSVYRVEQEAGVLLSKSLNDCLSVGSPQLLDGLIVFDTLYLLEQSKGLVSLALPDFTHFREYGVTGSKLSVTNSSLVVDGLLQFHLQNETFSSLSPPFTYQNDLFAHIKEYYFYHNSTHLLVHAPSLNLTTSEYCPSLRDLQAINDTFLLIVTSTGANLRVYSTEKTILHGRIPDDSGAVDVRFTATRGSTTISVSFSLLIESAPLKVLLLLLLSSGLVMGILGVVYLMYEASKYKARPVLPELTEDSGTALPTYARSVLT